MGNITKTLAVGETQITGADPKIGRLSSGVILLEVNYEKYRKNKNRVC